MSADLHPILDAAGQGRSEGASEQELAAALFLREFFKWKRILLILDNLAPDALAILADRTGEPERIAARFNTGSRARL